MGPFRVATDPLPGVRRRLNLAGKAPEADVIGRIFRLGRPAEGAQTVPLAAILLASHLPALLSNSGFCPGGGTGRRGRLKIDLL